MPLDETKGWGATVVCFGFYGPHTGHGEWLGLLRLVRHAVKHTESWISGCLPRVGLGLGRLRWE